MSEQQWKLVPVEPSDEMLREIHLVEGFTGRALAARYKAMLAAAPQPPALGGIPDVLTLKSGYLYRSDGSLAMNDEKVGYVAADYVTRLQAALTSANADKAAYAQNAIDLRRQLDESRAEAERYQTSAACALTSAENIQAELNQAQARTAALEGLLRDIKQSDPDRQCLSYPMHRRIDAALAEGAKCCEPTDEDLAALQAGDCTPEELWGGPRPTCRKCIGRAEGAKS